MPRLYIQYKENAPIPTLTQTLPSVIQGEEPVVGELVAACVSDPSVKGQLGIGQQNYGPFTLHLPINVHRSALDDKRYASRDSTTIDPGCPITELGDHGSESKNPLIIMNAGQGIRNWLTVENDTAQQLALAKGVADVHLGIELLIQGAHREPAEWKVVAQVSNNKPVPNSKLFHLDIIYLADSGLPAEKELILYCRPVFQEQFKFLQQRVIKNNVQGWILGPPGTGKSTTTLAFASTLNKTDWTVTWIHLGRRKLPFCIRIEDGMKKTLKFHFSSSTSLQYVLMQSLNTVDENKKHIVFLDGYVMSKSNHDDLLTVCDRWRDEGKRNRRLAVICSMAARSKVNTVEDMIDNVEKFYVYSWDKEEYLLAIQHDEFFDNVQGALDANDKSQEIEHQADPSTSSSLKADLIEAKFYYAGGSSRFMFDYPTSYVIEILLEAVESATDVNMYATGMIGGQSDHVINRLYSLHLVDSKRVARSISQYAAFQLALKLGPDLIVNLARSTANDSNPAMEGWIFESFFFSTLRKNGIELYEREGDEPYLKWHKAEYKSVDTKLGVFPPLSHADGVWLKPIDWQQGGYDAIYIKKSEGLVQFFQVTRGEKRSFKIEYFAKFASLLIDLDSTFEVKKLDIFFVVEMGKLEAFKVGTVSGEGRLVSFGWDHFKEKDKVKVLGMKGFNI
jgi:hypothetical protein